MLFLEYIMRNVTYPFLLQLPKKRKRPDPKPSYGPKTAHKPSASKSVQKRMAEFSKDDSDAESMASPKVTKLKSTPDTPSSPSVSSATKSKLALFTASESVSMNSYHFFFKKCELLPLSL